jgi:hypothetical protein
MHESCWCHLFEVAEPVRQAIAAEDILGVRAEEVESEFEVREQSREI